MSDIFISYASENRSWVKQLTDALVAAKDWSVWWDRDILFGKPSTLAIQEALDGAGCVIVVWSQSSVAKNWVIEEAEEGRDRQILIPVLMERVRPPLGFRQFQAVDLTDWESGKPPPEFDKLVAHIANILSSPSTNAQAKTQPKTDIERDKVGEQELKPPTVFRDTLKDGFKGPEMVRINGDTFWMGSPNSEGGRSESERRHRVSVEDFAIGKYPVTFEEYDLFCEATGRDKPAENV